MKVLWLTPYIPYPPDHGGKIRVFNLLSQLGRNHDIHLLSWSRDASGPLAIPEALGRLCVSVTVVRERRPGLRLDYAHAVFSAIPETAWRLMAREAHAALNSLLAQHDFDVAVLEQADTAGHLPALKRAGVPALLVCQNVETELWRSFARTRRQFARRLKARIETVRLSRFERMALRTAGYRVAMSRLDRDQLERMSGVPCGVSPNGVDLAHFAMRSEKLRSPGDPWRIVMSGSMGYAPNAEAAAFFLDWVMPLLRRQNDRIEVVFVGGSPPAALLRRQSEAIRFTGYVDDVRPHVAAADIFAVPLLQGSGTRLKVLEAMAQGVPLVSTSVGCEGIDAVHGTHLLVADTAETFCDAIAAVMVDKELRDNLVRHARSLVETAYDWRQLARRFELDLRRTARAGAFSGRRPA